MFELKSSENKLIQKSSSLNCAQKSWFLRKQLFIYVFNIYFDNVLSSFFIFFSAQFMYLRLLGLLPSIGSCT